LWGGIQQALQSSRFLLYFASPPAARSPWVARELEYWLANRDVEHLIVVLTDGCVLWDPVRTDFDGAQSTAIPDMLRGVFPGEPFYLDMRWARSDDGLSLANPRFKTQTVQIAAALKGLAVEDIIGEEVEQHRRMIRVRNAAIATLATLSIFALGFAGYAFTQRSVAIRFGEDARVQQTRAEQSAQEAITAAKVAEERRVQAQAAEDRATMAAAEQAEQRGVAEREAYSARVALAR
jgi:hypothetical protein